MTQGIIDWRYGEASLQHASTHGLINNKNYQRYLFLLTVVLTPMWVKENTSWWPLVIRKTFKSYFYFSVLWSMWVLRYISVEMLKITWRLLNFLPEHQLFDKPPKILDLSKQTDSSLEPNFRDGNGTHGNGIHGNLFSVNQSEALKSPAFHLHLYLSFYVEVVKSEVGGRGRWGHDVALTLGFHSQTMHLSFLFCYLK